MPKPGLKWDRTRAERKTRLKEEGRWDAFKTAREAKAKELGLASPMQADTFVEDDFAPLKPDGPPPEPVDRSPEGTLKGEFPGGLPDKRHAGAGSQLRAEDWVDKTCSIRSAYRWALDHLGIADADEECDPPSPVACDLWAVFRKNDKLRVMFYSDIGVKFLGSSPEGKTSEHTDDDAPVVGAINRLTRSLEAAEPAGKPVLRGPGARAEGAEGEPGVAPQDAP